MLEEYQIVLEYPELFKYIYPELRRQFLSQLLSQIEIVQLPSIPKICRDPDDDKVIATAIWGAVDYLATEDDDLRSKHVKNLLL